MYRIPAILGVLSLLIFGGVRVVKDIRFDQEIGGHLKLAADANSTELAERKLQLAVDGMKRWSLCNDGGEDCFTSILYRTPDEDVGYWRENIEGTLVDLQTMSKEERSDNLIVSNQLIKVRETLLDSGGGVTKPAGISIYPNNTGYAWWGWLSLLGFCIGLPIWFKGAENPGGW